MASLSNIKKRINSVNTTSKITQAMKLVATAKLQHQKSEFQKISNYTLELYDMLHNLTKSANYRETFVNKNTTNATLYIVISSSMGLCGAYNNNVCKYALNLLQPQDKMVLIGDKAYAYFKARDQLDKVILHINLQEKKLSYLDVWPVSQIIMADYETNKFAKVVIIYTKYKNSLSFDPITLNVLPFDLNMFNKDRSHIDEEFIDKSELNSQGQIIEFSPNRHTIINHFMEFYLGTMIVAALTESRLCEYSSRRNAMETATDNANDLIEQLKLEYNQARQDSITNEINEIVAGSES